MLVRRTLVARRHATRRPQSRMYSSKAQQALVSCEWLYNEMKNPQTNVKLIDASWFMPAQRRNPAKEFEEQRIAGAAAHFNIDNICDKSSSLPHMLPTVNQFEQQVSELGLSNNNHIVVYDTSGCFFASARVWWTFRLFGHDNVSVLDGGLGRWKSLGLPTESGQQKATNRGGRFIAREFRRHLLKTMNEILENIDTKTFQLVDARPAGRFNATEPEPRPNLVGGHVPGSLNLEFKLVVDPNTGMMKRDDELKQLFAQVGIDLNKPIATTCGSGVSASVIALALNKVGVPNVAVYDGSWSEYGQESLGNPVAK